MSRLIKFLPDVGSITRVEAENGITVDQFIELLEEEGGQLDLSKNMLTDKATRSTFLVGDAILPDGDITLISTIKDPKGNTARSEALDKVRSFKQRDGQRAVDYFAHLGNITQVKQNLLEVAIKDYSKKAPLKKPVNPVKATKKKLPKVVSKKGSKSSTSKSKKSNLDKETQEARAFQRRFKGSIYY